jgi:hypothetical protein
VVELFRSRFQEQGRNGVLQTIRQVGGFVFGAARERSKSLVIGGRCVVHRKFMTEELQRTRSSTALLLRIENGKLLIDYVGCD